jgi:signal transduction histidine kinase
MPNLTDPQIHYIKKIEDAGLKILDMINRSLDIFKMERGMYQFQPVTVNLVPLIRKILAEMQRRIQRKQVSVEYLLDAKPVDATSACNIIGEELLCYSMLANVMKNALEASPKNSPLAISLETKEPYIFIRIHNMGAVPEAIRETFFEKYVTAGKPSGTGLGTYSARLIAETHGGSIHMTTSEHEGTTVEIRLLAATD